MNIDEAIEVAGSLVKRGDFWDQTSEVQCAIILAAEVKRLREENEWLGIAGQQMANRLLEVLQANAPTAEESREAFDQTLAADGIGIGRYELMGRWDYCNYDARQRSKGWQAAIEWVTKRQQES